MDKKHALLVFCLLPFTLQAQQVWQLKSCIEFGLKNNRTNKIYQNEKYAADAKAKEALAAYLPAVSLTGTQDNNLKVQQTIIPAGAFSPVDQRIAFTKQFSTNTTAQLDQTIFDKSLLVGLKANKYTQQQAELNIQKNQEAIIYNISTAYYQIFVYQEQLSLLRFNQQTYRSQANVIQLKVNKGVTLQKELDKVMVDLNNAVSQARVAESNLTLSENQLKYEMGFVISEPLPIDTTAIGTAPDGLIAQDFQVTNRIDYNLAKVDVKLYEIDADRIKAGMYPKLTAYAKYGAVGYGNNLGESVSTMQTFSAIGIKLNIPLLDFFKRNAQYNQATYKRLNSLETLKLNEGKYQMEFENARTKLLKEQINVENNKRNIELAQSVFATTNLQYEKGTTDLTDWLNAQNSVKESQNNYLNSLYNFLLARIDLEKANGTLTAFYTSL